jgi:hypothetical protein
MAADFSRRKARPSRGGSDFGKCSFQDVGTSKPWATSQSLFANALHRISSRAPTKHRESGLCFAARCVSDSCYCQNGWDLLWLHC